MVFTIFALKKTNYNKSIDSPVRSGFTMYLELGSEIIF